MSGNQRVLIVDDEHVISNTLSTIFRNAGFDAKPVYSAEQALELLSDGSWPPDLAIIDVHLPQMNGIDLAIHLEAKHPGCKLSLFSGQTSSAELLEVAKEAGHAFEILAKPVQPTALLALAATINPPSGVQSISTVSVTPDVIQLDN